VLTFSGPAGAIGALSSQASSPSRVKLVPGGVCSSIRRRSLIRHLSLSG
jgi:hypothetical protein